MSLPFVRLSAAQFRDEVDNAQVPAGWRAGQFAFNALARVRPDLSARIRATNLDPFHRDERLPEFWKWVEENWSEPDGR